MTTTTKAEKAVKAEKQRINHELRQLQKNRKPLLTGRYIADVGWWGVPYCGRPCGAVCCEGCATRGYLLSLAEPLTLRIDELKQEMQRLAAEPEATREATVITGRGEQLVMFV